jgi:excinuclease UvrABC helicase subunit UvrB
MANGDRSRKPSLNMGPPAIRLDNRPLKFAEFEQHMGFTICTSATPSL